MPKLPHYCVVRVVNYKIQFLVLPETWDDLNLDIFLTHDRERAYNLAREFRGLLCLASGIPSIPQARAFWDALDALEDYDATGMA